MIQQARFGLEADAAHGALERPVVGVHQLVALQQLLVLEALVALVAHEPLAVVVLRVLVVQQAAGVSEDLIAGVAGETFCLFGRPVRVFVLVEFQALRIREPEAALVAFVLLLVGVLGLYVHLQVLFAGERFIALLAPEFFAGSFLRWRFVR